MNDRYKYKQLAKARLKSAKILYKYSDYAAAGYLLGYVVEFALKAAICKTLRLTDYPEKTKHHEIFATHTFDRLLILSGLSEDIDLSKNSDLFNNWSILTQDWTSDVRYSLNPYDKVTIEQKLSALEAKPNGFLTWLKGRKKW